MSFADIYDPDEFIIILGSRVYPDPRTAIMLRIRSAQWSSRI